MEQVKYFGIIGKNAAYSRSVELHNKKFAENGQHNHCYSFIDIPDLSALYLFFKNLNEKFMYSGISVTSPYMIDILPFLSELDEKARVIGAVNTVSIYAKDGILLSKGYNTDYTGFMKSLSHHRIHPRGKTAIILGTGGAARAVSAALYDSGIKNVTFVSTRPNRYETIEIISFAALRQEERFCDMLINCTPMGIFSLDLFKCLSSGLLTTNLIYDLNFPPKETEFIREARAMGIKSIGGSVMLEAQIKATHDIWLA